MSAPAREPGAETGTETTEVRKASNGAGFKAVDRYGRSTEEVRKLSLSPVISSAASPSAAPDAGPTPRPGARAGRGRAKVSPAAPPLAAGERLAWPHERSPAAAPDLGLHEAERDLIVSALAILGRRLRQPGAVLSTPAAVRAFLTLHLAPLEAECFAVVFLDAQYAVIRFEPMFCGTLTQTAVYPREIARRALALNAGYVVLAHNHPSGVPEPSRIDEALTASVAAVLDLIDVRVLDHVVVGGASAVSMAARGRV